MQQFLARIHSYWQQLVKASTTRIIAILQIDRSVHALEFFPKSMSFAHLPPLDPILESKQDLIITSLPSSSLFYGKIEGLPISFQQQLFKKKERIEGQIAQKVLWDISPYSYQYQFRKRDSKKTDLFFVLAPKDRLQNTEIAWHQKGIYPSIITSSFSAITHYLQFQKTIDPKVLFPCIVLLKNGTTIEKFEFDDLQDLRYSSMEEIDLFAFASSLDDSLLSEKNQEKNSGGKEKKFILSNFTSPVFASDLVDPDLFLKGLCLESLSAPKKWSSDAWSKKLKALLPLGIPLSKIFVRATYSFLALAILTTSVRFFSFAYETRSLDVELPFWGVSSINEQIEKDYSMITALASEQQSLKKSLEKTSFEKLKLLADNLHPISMEIDPSQIQITFVAPQDFDDETKREKEKNELFKKVREMQGTLTQDNPKSVVISFPLGVL